MNIGYAWLTGRVVGPDGAGRAGTVTLTPLERDWVGDLGDTSVVVTHRVVARIDSQGQVSGPDGAPGIRVAAPDALPQGAQNYLVTLDVPGDIESPRRYRARILAGTTVDLTDIISGKPVEDQSSPLARRGDAGLVEARDDSDIIDNGNGLLTWRD
jgi:hypothetical protein